MSSLRRILRYRKKPVGFLFLVVVVSLFGCVNPQYQTLRREGQRAMLAGMYGPARYFFEQSNQLKPREVQNLHDLGVCSIMLARQRFERMNRAAAMREVDKAIAYFSEALDSHPGHQASIEGKSVALKLKGQFDEALKNAEWAAEFVGPSAKEYLYLAQELEERGDRDGALLRYRQAVAIEPDNVDAHIAFAKFLIRNHHEAEAIHLLQAAYRLDPMNDWVADQLTQRGAIPPLAQQADQSSDVSP